jgi:hypothetical protein
MISPVDILKSLALPPIIPEMAGKKGYRASLIMEDYIYPEMHFHLVLY